MWTVTNSNLNWEWQPINYAFFIIGVLILFSGVLLVNRRCAQKVLNLSSVCSKVPIATWAQKYGCFRIFICSLVLIAALLSASDSRGKGRMPSCCSYKQVRRMRMLWVIWWVSWYALFNNVVVNRCEWSWRWRDESSAWKGVSALGNHRFVINVCFCC